MQTKVLRNCSSSFLRLDRRPSTHHLNENSAVLQVCLPLICIRFALDITCIALGLHLLHHVRRLVHVLGRLIGALLVLLSPSLATSVVSPSPAAPSRLLRCLLSLCRNRLHVLWPMRCRTGTRPCMHLGAHRPRVTPPATLEGAVTCTATAQTSRRFAAPCLEVAGLQTVEASPHHGSGDSLGRPLWRCSSRPVALASDHMPIPPHQALTLRPCGSQIAAECEAADVAVERPAQSATHAPASVWWGFAHKVRPCKISAAATAPVRVNRAISASWYVLERRGKKELLPVRAWIWGLVWGTPGPEWASAWSVR